jgi:YHS domain-containing protein
MKTDPVCGMQVDEISALHTVHEGETVLFCSEHCRAKFLKEPNKYSMDKDAGHSCCSEHGHSHHEPHKQHSAHANPTCLALPLLMALDNADLRRQTATASYFERDPKMDKIGPHTCLQPPVYALIFTGTGVVKFTR